MTVARQLEDPESTLSFFRRAFQLRRSRDEFAGQTVEWLDSPADSLVFHRSGGLVCVLNAGTRSVPLPEGEILFASGPLVDDGLPPDTAAWLV